MRVPSAAGCGSETLDPEADEAIGEQTVTKLREADALLAAGRTVAQVVQALGVSEQIDRRVHAHGLRHTHAAELRSEGVDNGYAGGDAGDEVGCSERPIDLCFNF